MSGILLHVTSLPSYGGVGDFGPAAYAFVDFLAAAKQRLWQVLPLSPTGYGSSPYSRSSAFAGNPLLISLERWSTMAGSRGTACRACPATTALPTSRALRDQAAADRRGRARTFSIAHRMTSARVSRSSARTTSPGCLTTRCSTCCAAASTTSAGTSGPPNTRSASTMP